MEELPETGVAVVGVGDGDAASEESCKIGRPYEFFFSFAAVGEGKGRVECCVLSFGCCVFVDTEVGCLAGFEES